ncbi:hypothetical protein PR048_015469 [Dryococelus australis]|uniref:Uncharacterized protein n=1 Tax=Dryococelus australis TaxID=614101 RepID=A0ABQ9HH17_9NEOP|nr:hypothetical protein PR048_015469 [Dryococelus australis]
MRRQASVGYPPRSPGLTVLDVYVRGTLKNTVNTPQSHEIRSCDRLPQRRALTRPTFSSCPFRFKPSKASWLVGDTHMLHCDFFTFPSVRRRAAAWYILHAIGFLVDLSKPVTVQDFVQLLRQDSRGSLTSHPWNPQLDPSFGRARFLRDEFLEWGVWQAMPIMMKLFRNFWSLGATVAERLACSPPTNANRVQSPSGSLPDFRMWELCRTMPLVGGFSRGPPILSRTTELEVPIPSELWMCVLFSDVSKIYPVKVGDVIALLFEINSALMARTRIHSAKHHQNGLHHSPRQPAAQPVGNLPKQAVANQAQGLLPQPLAANQRTGTLTSKELPRHFVSVFSSTVRLRSVASDTEVEAVRNRREKLQIMMMRGSLFPCATNQKSRPAPSQPPSPTTQRTLPHIALPKVWIHSCTKYSPVYRLREPASRMARSAMHVAVGSYLQRGRAFVYILSKRFVIALFIYGDQPTYLEISLRKDNIAQTSPLRITRMNSSLVIYKTTIFTQVREVSTGQRRNAGVGKREIPEKTRESMRKSGSGPAGNLTRFALVGGETRHFEGRGGAEARALASHQGELGSIPGRVTPGFPHVGLVPDDATGRRVSSGISRFLRPCVPSPLHINLISPSSALRTPLLIFAPLHLPLRNPGRELELRKLFLPNS